MVSFFGNYLWLTLTYCLLQMETEMIDKLDVFISGGMGDAKYRVMLYQM